jgi:uncharacterized protein
MDSEIQTHEEHATSVGVEPAQSAPGRADGAPPPPEDGLRRIFIGPQGLRAGWSVALFFLLFFAFEYAFHAATHWFVGAVLHRTMDTKEGMTAFTAIVGEGMALLAMICAGAIVASIERRRILDYNLIGPGRVSRFLSGVITGFAALSALVGALYLGGWIHFGPVALHGGMIGRYAALWGAAFILVALTEEGLCRCFLQFTLTRGMNFWWAGGILALLCAWLIPQFKNQAAWGVWIFAVPGIVHCLWLQRTQSAQRGFWYAAWTISAFFGFMHVSNNGESWAGILCAAAVGMVFAGSIQLTGSAWWAIGCHAAWDWAETFFYGTADSGLTAKGHFLATTPAGSSLWSGGTDGPEGSLLAVPVLAILCVVLLVQYGRRKNETSAARPALTHESGT